MNTKVLITGAAGFIGSTLVQKVINERDWEVWALDNNFRYSFEFLEKEKNPRLHIIKGDICDREIMENLFKENFDFVVHLAAIPGERLCKVYPEETIRTNIWGTKVILNELVKHKTRGLIFASSQVVYGFPEDFPLKETSSINPYDLYSFSKAADEMLIDIYKKKGLPVVAFRLSSVYGHGLFARWNEVVGRFVKLAHEQDYLTIYKPPNLPEAGQQAVDLINVHDIVDGIFVGINDINKMVGKSYNLSYGTSTSILKLAEVIKKITKEKLNKELTFKSVDSQEEEMEKIEVSNERIKKETGWLPKVSLEKGIEELFEKYDWYKKNYGNVKEPSLIKTPTRELI
jgi:nucleoside-diphosphate-sugar epimerase